MKSEEVPREIICIFKSLHRETFRLHEGRYLAEEIIRKFVT